MICNIILVKILRIWVWILVSSSGYKLQFRIGLGFIICIYNTMFNIYSLNCLWMLRVVEKLIEILLCYIWGDTFEFIYEWISVVTLLRFNLWFNLVFDSWHDYLLVTGIYIILIHSLSVSHIFKTISNILFIVLIWSFYLRLPIILNKVHVLGLQWTSILKLSEILLWHCIQYYRVHF